MILSDFKQSADESLVSLVLVAKQLGVEKSLGVQLLQLRLGLGFRRNVDLCSCTEPKPSGLLRVRVVGSDTVRVTSESCLTKTISVDFLNLFLSL